MAEWTGIGHLDTRTARFIAIRRYSDKSNVLGGLNVRGDKHAQLTTLHVDALMQNIQLLHRGGESARSAVEQQLGSILKKRGIALRVRSDGAIQVQGQLQEMNKSTLRELVVQAWFMFGPPPYL